MCARHIALEIVAIWHLHAHNVIEPTAHRIPHFSAAVGVVLGIVGFFAKHHPRNQIIAQNVPNKIVEAAAVRAINSNTA